MCYDSVERLTGAVARPTFLGGLGVDNPQSGPVGGWTEEMVDVLAEWQALQRGGVADDYKKAIIRGLITAGIWE